MDDQSWKVGLTPWQLLESAIRDKAHPGEPGDLALAEEAVAKGADVNHREQGWTALMYAAREDDAPIVEWLLARGARDDGAAVMEGARCNGPAALAALLRHGAPTDFDEHGDSPLSLAAQSGHHEVIRLLLQAGADPHHRDDSGTSALMSVLCAERFDLSLVQWFFEHGVRLTEIELRKVAAESGNPGGLEAALASPPELPDDGSQPIAASWAEQLGADAIEELWTSTLCAAAEDGAVAAVETILSHHSSAENIRHAWSRASWHGHREILDRLEQLFTPSQAERDDALLRAAWACNLGAVERLLDGGASPHARGHAGETPLHAARSSDVMDRLLAAGADLEARDNAGVTPLLKAVGLADQRQIDWLLDRGADLNAKDDRGLGAVAHAQRQWASTNLPPPPHVQAIIAHLVRRGCKRQEWPGERSESAGATLGCYLIVALVILVPIVVYALIVEAC